MPKPIRRSDRQNRDFLRRFFASQKGQEVLRGSQVEADTPFPGVQLLPEAEVYGTPTQYEEADLGKAALLALREGAGMVPIVGEALDVAEFENITRTGKDFYGDEADPTMYAGLTAAGMLLPNIIERPARAIGRGAKKLFKFGKESSEAAAPKSAKPFLEVEDIMVADGKSSRTIMDDYDLKFMNAPSSKLRHMADQARNTAKHSNHYLGDVYDALVEGKVDNPFNTEAQRVVFEKFGLVGDFNKDAAKVSRVRSNNTARYLNWLSVRHPDLVEDIAKGSEDALYRAMNDKSLADGFMADAETVYRGVTLSPDDPSVREALINPKPGMGERVLGEGVYTTADPNEAFSYATKLDLLYGLNEKGLRIPTGRRITRKGSVGVLQTDVDYDSPLDLINKLDNTAVSRAARRDRKLPEGVVSSLEVHGGDAHRIYSQGPDGAKLKIKEIIPQSEFDKVDMKFWGSMEFNPNKLDKTYFRGMKESEAFKQAEQQFKNLREPELKKLRRLALAYDVAGTVARAAEVGIVVSAPTVAILKASSYLFGDDDSNQKAGKAQGGVIYMKKKPTGMSVIRK
jgi:hypothetical protein